MVQEPQFHDHRPPPPKVGVVEAAVPTALEEYLFYLNGYLLLPALLTPSEIAEGNARIDAIRRDLPRRAWHGWVQREDHPELPFNAFSDRTMSRIRR